MNSVEMSKLCSTYGLELNIEFFHRSKAPGPNFCNLDARVLLPRFITLQTEQFSRTVTQPGIHKFAHSTVDASSMCNSWRQTRSGKTNQNQNLSIHCDYSCLFFYIVASLIPRSSPAVVGSPQPPEEGPVPCHIMSQNQRQCVEPVTKINPCLTLKDIRTVIWSLTNYQIHKLANSDKKT